MPWGSIGESSCFFGAKFLECGSRAGAMRVSNFFRFWAPWAPGVACWPLHYSDMSSEGRLTYLHSPWDIWDATGTDWCYSWPGSGFGLEFCLFDKRDGGRFLFFGNYYNFTSGVLGFFQPSATIKKVTSVFRMMKYTYLGV